MAHLQCAVKPPDLHSHPRPHPVSAVPGGVSNTCPTSTELSGTPASPSPSPSVTKTAAHQAGAEWTPTPPHTHTNILPSGPTTDCSQLCSWGRASIQGPPPSPTHQDPASPLPNTSAHPHCPQEALGLSSGPDTLVPSLRDKAGHAEGVRAPARPASTATGKCGEPSRRSLSVGPGRGPWRHRAPPKTQAKPREAQPLTHTTG